MITKPSGLQTPHGIGEENACEPTPGRAHPLPTACGKVEDSLPKMPCFRRSPPAATCDVVARPCDTDAGQYSSPNPDHGRGTAVAGDIDVIGRLHKGLGIRRPDLLTFTAGLHSRWRVPPTEKPVTLRSRLIWHVGRALSTIGDPIALQLGRAGYNLDRDYHLSGLDFGKRIETAMDGRRATAHRMFHGVVKDIVVPALTTPLEVPHEDLQDIITRELGFVRQRGVSPLRSAGPTILPAGHEELHQAISTLYTSPYPRIVRRFLRSVVVIPTGPRPGLIVTETRRAGHWVCAYSDHQLLRDHAAVAGLPWTGHWQQVDGVDLVRMIRSLPVPAGMLLNPPLGPAADLSRTLPLTAPMLRNIEAHPGKTNGSTPGLR